MKIKVKLAQGNVEVEFDSKEEYYNFVKEWLMFIESIKKIDDMS